MNASIVPSLPEFRKLASRGNLIPVFREISADLETPVSTFLKLAGKSRNAFLLESVEGGERWGRYSFISWDPSDVFISTPGVNPIAELREKMRAFKPVEVKGLPRFWGGAVGYCSYDTVRFFENLPDKPKESFALPDAVYFLTGKLVVFDHLNHTVKIVNCVRVDDKKDTARAYTAALAEIDEVVAQLRKPLRIPAPKTLRPSKLRSNQTLREYCSIIEKAKEHIRAGDIIQVVLSQRLSRPTAAGGFDIYRNLRLVNPSPYMYYFRFNGFEMVGSSPEVLVRKEDRHVETKPIAGTRPRGKTDEDEVRLARELLADPKERAEHIMLVDLGRNDLGRVCEPASVTVPQLMNIEKYSHVMHIVSSVTGLLRKEFDAYDLLRACFPAGTLSGAPKVRAMQIIDELEPEARGAYGGAVGYFSYAGNMDMAITIRTMVLKDGVAYAQAGAGIVADSVPESEHQESCNKAAAVFAAIDRAERGAE